MLGVTIGIAGIPAVITASRYHDFSYGHVVLGHESKCANLHGHNGRIHFKVGGASLDQVGRVIDFSDIKTRLCEWVEQNWDHRFLISQDHDLATTLFAKDPTVVVCNFNPTAENMAAYMLHVIGPLQLKGTGLTLMEVVLEETRKCKAEARLTLGQLASYGGLPAGLGYPGQTHTD
jgi:6-pyruvoyltetrahydropterin/6-carboxytetrahydropterin synthase